MSAAVRRARSPQGTAYQLSLCTTEELKTMMDTAFTTMDQLVRYVDLLMDEMKKRGEALTSPDQGA